MRQTLWLVKNGMDFDVAVSLDEVERVSFSIIFSELDGRKFNFSKWEFEKENEK